MCTAWSQQDIWQTSWRSTLFPVNKNTDIIINEQRRGSEVYFVLLASGCCSCSWSVPTCDLQPFSCFRLDPTRSKASWLLTLRFLYHHSFRHASFTEEESSCVNIHLQRKRNIWQQDLEVIFYRYRRGHLQLQVGDFCSVVSPRFGLTKMLGESSLLRNCYKWLYVHWQCLLLPVTFFRAIHWLQRWQFLFTGSHKFYSVIVFPKKGWYLYFVRLLSVRVSFCSYFHENEGNYDERKLCLKLSVLASQ